MTLSDRTLIAHGDAWQVEGALRIAVGGGCAALPGVRLMSSGLPHAQWNNGDVHDAGALDLDAVGAWYLERGVPWGLRVPGGVPLAAGRKLFTKRLMALEREACEPSTLIRGLFIRRAVTADLGTVAAIDASAFGDTSPEVTRWIAPRLGSERHVIALAELSSRPVGAATLTLADGWAGSSAYVSGVGVLPDARRRGVATAMSAWLVDRAFERGATLVHLHPDNAPAARVYERLGFVHAGELDIYIEL